jgi:hypothetical protein
MDGHAIVLPDQPGQQVAGADVPAMLRCRSQRELEALLGLRRERDVPAQRLLAGTDEDHDLPAHGVQGDADRVQGPRGRTMFLPEQARQHVLGAHVIVLQSPGLFLGQDDGSPGLVGEQLEHGVTPTSRRPRSVPPVCTRRLSPGGPGTRRS